MTRFEIETENLRLVLQSTEEVLAMIESLSPTDRAEVSPAWLARLRESAPDDPWTHGFAIILRETASKIGDCGFKGPPDADSAVEIAYGINDPHRNRGFATEAARALTTHAFATGLVCTVRAHTKIDNPASARVLIKTGFRELGPVHDPEDGLVLRWEIES